MGWDYIRQLNAFGDLSIGTLTRTGQLLYLRLFLVNNRAGRAEWFSVTNQRLGYLLDVDEKTIQKARDELKTGGFIDYRKGKKGQPTLYKLIPLYEDTNTENIYGNNSGEYSGESSSISSSESSGENSGENSRHIKGKGKDKEKEAAATRAREVVSLFENVIHPVSNIVERDELLDMIEEDGYERVTEAIKEAARHRARSVRYIGAILNRWRNNGKDKSWEKQKSAPDTTPQANSESVWAREERLRALADAADEKRAQEYFARRRREDGISG